MNYFSRLPRDIIDTCILPCLDGETLIALSSVSYEFFPLINEDQWRNICISTWPSLLLYSPKILSKMISMFPYGYRSFFSDAFPSIHHPNTPPPPPPHRANFNYAIDIFLQGEQEEERLPLYANVQYQYINIKTCRHSKKKNKKKQKNISTGGSNAFKLFPNTCYSLYPNLKFIPVKKDGCEEYLKEKLKLSCVLVSSRYDLIPRRNRAWGLFSSSCKPDVYVSTSKRWAVATYETVMPGLFKYYTEMVKFQMDVNCRWEDGEEDRFYVSYIMFRMKDMNGKLVKEEDAAKVLLNAIENGERKKK
ncbi:F-box protein At2g27310-like [Trifolium pratense]|uniref:F-box protein At2g27310-like n=1 Tax=Trifolium pratense TaxID=57577 RepID=UPI001E69575F|nr:F-box protein At2g27310-like [Trifolium pratense]